MTTRMTDCQLEAQPRRSSELRRAASGITHALADQIAAPMMLIHGDADFVRLSQAQAMLAALYRQG